MKIHRGKEYIHIDLSGAEAAVLLEELEHVPGGSKMPKLRQVCVELGSLLRLSTLVAPPQRGRPKKHLALVGETQQGDAVEKKEPVSDKRADAHTRVEATEGPESPPEPENNSLKARQPG